MNAIQTETEPLSAILPELAPPPSSPPLLRTLVACDLVESTAMTEQLGDRGAADFVHQLDRHSRDLLQRHGGQEIDKSDGFLLLFDRPIQAVAFALDYQRLLRELGRIEFLPLSARIGIHVGDVVLWRNVAEDIARGAKPVEIEGLVKPVAARLMNLALPGQTLLSGIAHTLALRAQDELPPADVPPQWRAHGHYRFKGVAEPIAVFEIGEPGVAPLRAPAYSGKAHRELPWWRRPGMVVLEAAVLVLAIALPLYFSLRSPAAIAFAARDWIVVGDLKNQTGQGVLDDSLDTAFRVSVEQSRYINLVSELQMRDALARMEKPADTKVDRAIGSEIALREGARALILPSVAEVGNRVRVTAEVVDPHTQGTVYVETADGTGLESILPSIGKVSNDLRGRLGEALASVAANNAPLPQVTTGNLDALRAYALGVHASADGRWSEALSLFDQAIKLDPKFALAYMGKAGLHIGANDNAGARADLQHVEALREHLPPRDALRFDGLLSMFGPPDEALEKWKLLGTLYPDAYFARYYYAQIAWASANRYDDAIAELSKAFSDHNSHLGSYYYLLGTLQLASEHYDEASKDLTQAQTLHAQSLGLVIAESHAVKREFESARKAFADSKPTGVASNDIAQKLTAITLPLDEGHWDNALAAARQAINAADAAGPLYGRLFRATELSLLVLSSPPAEYAQKLRPFLDNEFAILQRKDDIDRPIAVFNVLLGAYFAARSGNIELATKAIAAGRDDARDSGYPNLTNMLAIANAERARANGRPADAITLLKPQLDGTELYLTHVALRDAYKAAGQREEALREAVWLTSHRGRAYEEYNNDQALQALNVAESDLASLDQAELATTLGEGNQSSKALNDFLVAWPEAKQIEFLSKRLEAVAKH
ncbi:MAG: putative peptide modification system cyclase [Rudaea sp.]|nr:putative peptide modification system cyclase [Rudaea sp.]